MIDEDLESLFGKKYFRQAHKKRNHYAGYREQQPQRKNRFDGQVPIERIV